MRRRLIALALALCITACAFVALPVASAENPTAYVISNTLQIFQADSVEAKPLATLSYGESLTRISIAGEWAKVKSGATKGYCRSDSISGDNPNTMKVKARVVTANAPLYRRPDKSSGIWMRLKKGVSCTAVAITRDNAWVRLKKGRHYAYMEAINLSAEKKEPVETLAPTPSPSVAPTPAPKEPIVYVAANTAALHKKASASSKILTTLGYGTGVTLLGTSGKWAKIRTGDGRSGFGKISELSKEDPNTYSQVVYVTSETAPLCQLPLADSPVWGTLRKNESYTAVAVTADGAWLRLKNGNYYGYVQSQHVSTEKPVEDRRIYVTGRSVDVYAEASLRARKLGQLYLGQSAMLVGISDGWAKLLGEGNAVGYCMLDGLSEQDPNTLNQPRYAKENGVKLYAQPSAAAKVAATIPRNTGLMLVCITPNGKWGRVALGDGGYAYVRMSKLSEQKVDDGTQFTDIEPVDVYVLPTTITVYASPDIKAKSLGTMSFGESMRCTGKSAAWARVVNSLGTVGYCELNAVSAENPNTFDTTLYAQVNGAKLFGRPKASAAVLSTLGLNEKVTAVNVNEDRSWYRVQYDKAYGYVQAAIFATSKMKDDTQSGTVGKVIQLAKSFLGVPYVYAGQSPAGFDCSGLVYYVFKKAAGVSLKRTAYAQGYDESYPKIAQKTNLKAGDLLFFNTVSSDNDACDHVGIYLGGNQFIHASSGGGKVIISNLGTDSSSYYFRNYSWGRRILT